MKSYGQFCPVAKAAELFCERWTPLIVRDLAGGALRFSQLQRGVPLMSPSLLSRRLKELQAEGIVERQRAEGGKTWTYHLTPAGEEFVPMVELLGVWGQRWSRRQLEENEIDLGLLLWSLERGVRPDAFEKGCAVVRLELTDQPAGHDRWWFLNQENRCTLCLEDPGFEVELYLACSLPDIIYVVRGDLALRRALADDRIEAIGSHDARRRLATWLNLSPLAEIKSQRHAAPPP